MSNLELDPKKRFLTPGATVREFELKDDHGNRFSTNDLLRDGPLIITFYRGAWCSCCRADLKDLAQVAPTLRRDGISIIGVFNQLSPTSCARIVHDYGIEFPILNDNSGETAEAFGVRRSLAEMAKVEAEFGPEVLALKEGQPWIMAMQARFIVDQDRSILSSDVLFKYDERSDVEHVFAVLKRRA
jgi:peroxiredoxin